LYEIFVAKSCVMLLEMCDGCHSLM
jgi:hypothetical protein